MLTSFSSHVLHAQAFRRFRNALEQRASSFPNQLFQPATLFSFLACRRRACSQCSQHLTPRGNAIPDFRPECFYDCQLVSRWNIPALARWASQISQLQRACVENTFAMTPNFPHAMENKSYVNKHIIDTLQKCLGHPGLPTFDMLLNSPHKGSHLHRCLFLLE